MATELKKDLPNHLTDTTLPSEELRKQGAHSACFDYNSKTKTKEDEEDKDEEDKEKEEVQ